MQVHTFCTDSAEIRKRLWHYLVLNELALGRKADTSNHVCITLVLFPLPHWLSVLELPFQYGFQNHLHQGKLYILKHDSVSHTSK
mgnify:CR=1 FL=1